MDCPDTCALEVRVEEGRIASIRGAKDHPTTAGFICSKVAHFDRRVYHSDRLLYPMRRTGAKGSGEFIPISWEEAIGEITNRFREIILHWGGEAILPYHYGGSNGYMSDGFLDDLYFAKLGASRLARTLCAAPATAVATGMYGKMPGVAFEDYAHAKFILIWGANAKASNIHLVPFLRQAKRNGAFVAVADPITNFTAGEVDLHLPVFPGADLPVALAMIRLWKQSGRLNEEFLGKHADGLERLLAQADAWPLERAAAAARVPADDIRRLAEVYSATSPAVIRVGWGLERNRNGGQAMAAILAMPALLGKFGVRGGGYTLSNSGAAKLNTKKLLGDTAWNTREINMTELGAVLAGSVNPPVKGLFVYNCNPAATVPDQEAVLRGLAREDLFTVVSEQVMTDSAKYADILLPATTFLEHYDIRRGYGSYVVGGLQPAIAPRGEARPNEAVFAALGQAMGWNDAPFFWDAATRTRKVAEAITIAGRPVDPSLLTTGGMQGYDFPGARPVQFQTVFPQTPDKKVHLTPPDLGPKPFTFDPVTSEKFPLALVSPATSKMISSTMGEWNYPELRVNLNPRDAAARGIAADAVVRVFNELSEVVCRAQINGRIREGVVAIPKGAWRKSSRNGRTATALCPATTNVVGGGACFNDARVEVTLA
jgi:anaerobic selenocysteine-containing dehydrogenase